MWEKLMNASKDIESSSLNDSLSWHSSIFISTSVWDGVRFDLTGCFIPVGVSPPLCTVIDSAAILDGS